MGLPGYVNAVRVVTYNTDSVRKSIAEIGECDIDSVDDYEVMNMIFSWADEDHGGKAYVLTNEYGEVL